MEEEVRSLAFGGSIIGFVVVSAVYLYFAGHYFIVTMTATTSGEDEVRFPEDTFAERAWRPLAILWIIGAWLMIGSILLVPCLASSPLALGIALAILLWFVFPFSVLSACAASHWTYIVHPTIIWRLVRQYHALTYVYFITLLCVAVCVAFLVGVFGHSFIWAVPASFVIPTALLLYARHWGRFAWWALTCDRKKKKRRRRPVEEPGPEDDDEDVPEMEVEEVPLNEAIQEGLPPASPHAYQQLAVPSASAETAAAEEDEFSRDKAPYAVIEEQPKPVEAETLPVYAREPASDADKPISLVEYYAEQAKQEKERQKKLEEAQSFLPPTKKKAATFQSALLWGVWVFMIYPNTLQVWVLLVALTVVELFFLSLVVRFWPGA